MRLRWTLAVHLGATLAVCLLLVTAFEAVDMQPRPAWFVGGALAVAFVSVAVRRLGELVARTTWPQYDAETVRVRNSDSRVQFLSTRLQEATRTRDGFVTRVQPALAELVSARLLHRHGVDLTTQPAAARAITGDWLWDLITTDVYRPVPYSEIERAAEAIEQL